MRTNLVSNPLIYGTAKKEASSAHDMIVAFDTTGSMSAYIEAVKKHVVELIPDLFSKNPDIRIGIVAFGDYCDMESKDVFGKAYQSLDLTTDKEDIIKFVKNARNTGGGDGDEFYELVIHKIVTETSWRKDAKKSVLLIADANPHPVGYSYKDIVKNNNISWKEEANKAAELGIEFDTLSINPSLAPWFKELSDITNGVHAPFSSSNKTQEIFKMAAYSRGGSMAKAAYESTLCTYKAAGDTEMVATANSYMKKINE